MVRGLLFGATARREGAAVYLGANQSGEAKTCALNERGVRPARGTRWYASSAANLLSYEQKFAVRLTVL
jgi:hypothetical protein